MKSNTILSCIILWVCCSPADAFERYRPMGLTGINEWNSNSGSYHPIKPADRVVLPGLRPVSAELLERTLEQRYRRSLGNSPKAIANRAVPKIFSDGPAFARARGIYAELWYANQNPHSGLVAKRNATQMDAYTRPLGQRPPIGIQIKTLSGGPAAYIQSMREDNVARWFVIPDDHVEGVREYWLKIGDNYAASGNRIDANKAYRQLGRVQPLGIKLADMEAEMRSGGRHLMGEQSARYVSYGAVLALFSAPVIADLVKDGRISENSYRQLVQGVTLASTAAGMDQILLRFKDGALRGTLKGNILTGTALLLVDTGFAFHDFGGMEAFSRPAFYERVGGSVGALTLSLAVGLPVGIAAAEATAATVVWAPAAPIVGAAAGFTAGTAAGIAGHFGGVHATRFILHATAQDMLLKQDLQPIQEIRTDLKSQITAAQNSGSLK